MLKSALFHPSPTSPSPDRFSALPKGSGPILSSPLSAWGTSTPHASPMSSAPPSSRASFWRVQHLVSRLSSAQPSRDLVGFLDPMLQHLRRPEEQRRLLSHQHNSACFPSSDERAHHVSHQSVAHDSIFSPLRLLHSSTVADLDHDLCTIASVSS